MEATPHSRKPPLRWAIFVSGRGSNLRNVLELERSALKRQTIALVVSDRECPAEEIAKTFQKEVLRLSPKNPYFSENLVQELQSRQINCIFLLGYMRILPATVIERCEQAQIKPILNLHPSWLPEYKGLHAIESAFREGKSYFGVTIHEVIAELDSGPILRQASVPREANWTLEEATEAVHSLEHELVRDFLLDLE